MWMEKWIVELVYLLTTQDNPLILWLEVPFYLGPLVSGVRVHSSIHPMISLETISFIDL